MKLLIITIGTNVIPSSRTRAFQWIPHLNKKGVCVKTIPLSLSLRYKLGLDSIRLNGPLALSPLLYIAILGCLFVDAVILPFQLLKIILIARKSNAIYLQKVLFPGWYLCLLSSVNPNIGYDFDDAIQEESPQKLARLKKALKLSKLITVENLKNGAFTKEITGRDPMYMLGPIDCDRYQPKSKTPSNTVVVGWIGSHSTTIYLEECKNALFQTLETHPQVELHLIGAAGSPIIHPRCIIKPWKLETECQDLALFDIGIMPLTDTPWTQGKGGYKILQYMALGIPSVVSPVGVNSQIINPEINGFHAKSNHDWFAQLSKIVQSPRLRKKMGEEARKKAVSQLSFESYGSEFFDRLKELSQIIPQTQSKASTPHV